MKNVPSAGRVQQPLVMSQKFYLLVLEHVAVAILIGVLYIVCAVLVFGVCIVSYYGAFGDFEIGAPRLLAMACLALCMSSVPPVIGICTATVFWLAPKPNK